MLTNNDIKRGISLYSFQESYFFKRLDLEDCIAAAADMGVEGIEIIPDQMIYEFPNVSDDFIDKWHGMMERYGVRPVCIDDFVESNLYKHRKVSIDEQVERFIRAVKLAKRLGCFLVREQFALGGELMTPELLEKCLPHAEKHGIIIGMEVHAPNYLGNPEIEPYMKIMEKSPYVALVVDFSIFMHTIPDVINQYYMRHGARQEVIDFALECYKNKMLGKDVIEEAHKKFKLLPIEERYFKEQFRFNRYIEPEIMKDYAPFIKHFHAKTFGVNENLVDEAIDYPRIFKVIKEMGYKGYISGENEGNRYVHDAFEYDDIEQAIRHQKLMENLLGY